MVHRTLPAAVTAALALAAAPALAHDPDHSPRAGDGLGNVRADPTPSKDPSRIALTPTEDPTTSAGITWRTDAAITEGAVEVAPATGGTVRTVQATAGNPVSFAGWTYMSRHHSAVVGGLEPARRYRYRVGFDGAWSGWREFRTASADSAEPWSMLYFGDAQNDVERAWTPVVEQAFRTAPDALVHLHAGDLINTASSDDEWRQWFGALGERVSTISTVAAVGNHELSGDAQALQFREHFTFPLNGPQMQHERAYYTDVQNARIITLNSNLSFDDPLGALTQTTFLEEALRSSDKQWNVVTFHHPLFSASEGRDNPHLRLLWLNIVEQHDVDLVLQGHDHAYSRGHVAANEDAQGRNTGPVYVVSVSGPKYYDVTPEGDNNWTQNGARRVAAFQQTSTFQHLRFERDRILYRAVVAAKGPAATTDRAPGEVVDAFTITKNAGGKVVTEGADFPG